MATRKNVRSVPENPSFTDVRASSATSLTERIRTLAYTLHEQRGREEGHAEQDWLQAEAEILGSERTFEAAA